MNIPHFVPGGSRPLFFLTITSSNISLLNLQLTLFILIESLFQVLLTQFFFEIELLVPLLVHLAILDQDRLSLGHAFQVVDRVTIWL